MSTTTLTDRYVWTVTRALPPETGPDVARELRSSIEETIEGRVAAGEDPGAAERETVLGLGDPDVLAREYGRRPNHLVGPDVFPAWVRLVKVLLAVVVPIAVAGDLAANALASDKGFGELVGGAAVVALHTGVHLVFWTTLVFALVERRGGREEREQIAPAWDPDTLTRARDERRIGLGELVLELVTDAVVILVVVWQLGGVGEHGVQVLDPTLAWGWKVLVLAPLLVDLAITVAVWARGAWSARLALGAVASAVVSGVVLVGLLLGDLLLTDVPAAVEDTFGWPADWTLSVPTVAVGVLVICGWEAVTALRHLRDSRRAGEPVVSKPAQ